MKKVLSFTAIIVLFISTNISASTNNVEVVDTSCFQMANELVTMTEGGVNIENIGFVLELTRYLRSTGICN